jgi:sugar phosphate permease
LITLVPRYFTQMLNMSISGGIISTVLLPIGMALGSFVTPWVSDWVHKRFGSRAPAIVVCGLCTAITVFLFAITTSQLIATILLFFAGFFILSINGVIWAYSTDIGTRAFASTAAGVLDWAAYMGAAAQAVVFGFILGDANNWTFVFISLAAFAILNALFAWLAGIRPKTRPEV